MIRLRRVAAGCGLVLALGATPVWAGFEADPQGPPGGRGRPPQAAFDACSGKSAGETVELATPRGTLTATCREFDGQLTAVPDGPPLSGPPGAPPRQ